MKIIVTGSLGHISKPLTQQLVKHNHEVVVITSNPERKQEIETLGASAAVGSLEDVNFLIKSFAGADVTYCMVPPNNYFDPNLDLIGYYQRLGRNYAKAISESGVKRVVNLSTIGAHLEKGSGILLGAHHVQNILNELPVEVGITHMRPTSFFYNLYGYAQMITSQGKIMTNYGTGPKIPWVSPLDIADAVAEEIETAQVGRKIRYVASEELTGAQTASIIGEAIGKPDLEWQLATDEQTLTGLVSIGMNKQIAAGIVELYAGLQSGLLSESYYQNRPAVLGRVKLKAFAKEFASNYNQKH